MHPLMAAILLRMPRLDPLDPNPPSGFRASSGCARRCTFCTALPRPFVSSATARWRRQALADPAESARVARYRTTRIDSRVLRTRSCTTAVALCGVPASRRWRSGGIPQPVADSRRSNRSGRIRRQMLAPVRPTRHAERTRSGSPTATAEVTTTGRPAAMPRTLCSGCRVRCAAARRRPPRFRDTAARRAPRPSSRCSDRPPAQ